MYNCTDQLIGSEPLECPVVEPMARISPRTAPPLPPPEPLPPAAAGAAAGRGGAGARAVRVLLLTKTARWRHELRSQGLAEEAALSHACARCRLAPRTCGMASNSCRTHAVATIVRPRPPPP